MSKSLPLTAAEEVSHKLVHEQIEALEVVGQRMSNLLGRLLGSFGVVTGSNRALTACSCLYTKVVNDARAVHILASLGYHQQAVTLVSSMQESVFTIMHIGNDNQLGQEWLAHSAEQYTFVRPTNAIEHLSLAFFTRANAADPKALAAAERRAYTIFCMLKHSNPIVQRELGYLMREDTAVHTDGPDCSEAGVMDSVHALYQAIKYLAMTIWTIGVDHASPEQWAAVLPEYKKLRAQLMALYEAHAVQRAALGAEA